MHEFYLPLGTDHCIRFVLIVAVCFLVTFSRRGGTASDLVALAAPLLALPSYITQVLKDCVHYRRSGSSRELSQLLWSDEDGSGSDELDIEDLDSLPSPSRSKPNTMPSYGTSSPIARSFKGVPIVRNNTVLGRLASIVQSRRRFFLF